MRQHTCEKPVMERTATMDGIARGPRWIGLPSFLRNIAHVHGLKITMDIDKGWFKETVRYTLAGPLKELKQAEWKIDAAVKEYKK